MPASGKMLKSRQQAANRAAGIGDADGRLPNRIKPTETNVKCSQCGMEIRATKTNTEARQHAESRHPAFTFAVCFVGAFDPTAAPPATGGGAASFSAVEGDGGLAEDMAALKVEPAAAPEKPKKKKDDLSFLDAALDPKAASKKK